MGSIPYAQATATSGGCAYRIRIKFLLRIIFNSDTYSSNWACRQHPRKRLSSSADHGNLPESDTGALYSALACPKDLTIFMSQLDLEALLQRVPESNAAKSARRIFFNYLEEPLEERGYFHVDLMHGSGSSVLLRSSGRFFLLTARHVLSNNMSLGFQNESDGCPTSPCNRHGTAINAILS